MSIAVNVFIIAFLLLIKIVYIRKHFLVLLLILEAMIIVIYYIFNNWVGALNRSSLSLFIFIVIIVAGACVGLAIMALISRSTSKEREFIMVK